MRLIRSKGVGVYFITQNPIDIPDTVAGQLGNRVQHALRAFTPRDQAAVKSAATTFRANPGVDVEKAITELKVGEALVSLLLPDGAPAPVERTLIKPPASRVGPVTPVERGVMIQTDPIGAKYDTLIDRGSAEEILSAKSHEASAAAAEAAAKTEADKAAALQAKEDARAARKPNASASPTSARRIVRRSSPPSSRKKRNAPPPTPPGTAPSPPPLAPPPRRSAGRSRTKCRKRCSAHRAAPARASSAGWCAGFWAGCSRAANAEHGAAVADEGRRPAILAVDGLQKLTRTPPE